MSQSPRLPARRRGVAESIASLNRFLRPISETIIMAPPVFVGDQTFRSRFCVSPGRLTSTHRLGRIAVEFQKYNSR